jgi:hypothetical protein
VKELLLLFYYSADNRNEKQKHITGGKPKSKSQNGDREEEGPDHIDARTCQLLSYMWTSTLHLKYPK